MPLDWSKPQGAFVEFNEDKPRSESMVSDDGGDQARADRRAVELVARGEVDALGELYDRHARLVYSLALRIVTDQADAEEVVQDVFTQVWRQSARYDGSRATVMGWLLMTTRARAIDRLRARQSRPDMRAGDRDLRDTPTAIPSQETQATDLEIAQALKAALDTLSDTLRAPIELAYYEGLSHAEIAERLGKPLGTVKTYLRTALMRLRVVLYRGGEA
jgi:RNA polymerase sigma-70 factor (ECF subfamily)